MSLVFIGDCDAYGTAHLATILSAHPRCTPVPYPRSRSAGVEERFGPTLVEQFPAARFVHLVGDGRRLALTVLGSCAEPLTVRRAAQWWTETLGHGLMLESSGGARVMRLRYEDLVLDAERVIGRLAGFLGIDPEPRMLSVADGPAPRAGAATPRDIGAWERVLTSRQIEVFEAVTFDLLGYLGYQARFGARARPASLSECLRGTLAEACRGRRRARRPDQRVCVVETSALRRPGEPVED